MTEEEIVKKYRAKNPHSRATRMFKYGLNTSRRRSLICLGCGEERPSWCVDWPRTANSLTWESEHRVKHLR